MNLQDYFMFSLYRLTKELGTKLPETPSVGKEISVLLPSAGISLEKQVLWEQVTGRVPYFDVERTNQVPWCCQVERGKPLVNLCLAPSSTCQGSPELIRWEHIHLKLSEPSS